MLGFHHRGMDALFFGKDLQIETLNESMQIVGMYAEKPCGLGVVAGCSLECIEDQSLLRLFDGLMVFCNWNAGYRLLLGRAVPLHRTERALWELRLQGLNRYLPEQRVTRNHRFESGHQLPAFVV